MDCEEHPWDDDVNIVTVGNNLQRSCTIMVHEISKYYTYGSDENIGRGKTRFVERIPEA
jgi:hypothetical protein